MTDASSTSRVHTSKVQASSLQLARNRKSRQRLREPLLAGFELQHGRFTLSAVTPRKARATRLAAAGHWEAGRKRGEEAEKELESLWPTSKKPLPDSPMGKEPETAETWYARSCSSALTARGITEFARDRGQALEPDEKRLLSELKARALGELRTAIEAGLTELERRRTDDCFVAIKDDDEFKRLLSTRR